MTEYPYRLRLPGPTVVPLRLYDAQTHPILNHRGPEFNIIHRETTSLLQPIMGTSNEILFFASSGTGVMEASLVNVLTPGDWALVLSSGQFSERFIEIAKALGLQVDIIEAPWGEMVDPKDVAVRLAERDYRVVVAVHNESSTGAVTDLAALGRVVRETSALLIVDSVSGLGGVEMRQDDWGVDVLVSASQKALMCPPGLGLVSVSSKAWEIIEKGKRMPCFYWDFLVARDEAINGQTAFTTPVSLVAGLREALTMIHEEGVDNVLTRHRQLANAMRAGGEALGLSLFTRSPIISNTVTVFSVPEGLDGTAIVNHMHEHHGTVIAGARNRLKGKVIRIGTMGYLKESDIFTDMDHLEKTLESLNWPVIKGRAMSVAKAALKMTSI